MTLDERLHSIDTRLEQIAAAVDALRGLTQKALNRSLKVSEEIRHLPCRGRSNGEACGHDTVPVPGE